VLSIGCINYAVKLRTSCNTRNYIAIYVELFERNGTYQQGVHIFRNKIVLDTENCVIISLRESCLGFNLIVSRVIPVVNNV
jgi:hypothetical protein